MSTRSRRSPLQIRRAVIYVRVSKDDGRRGRSCKEQAEACTADCEYEQWPIGHILEDNDRGASRHSKRERDAFKRLPGVLRRGDVLVVWEPSRITRNMAEFATFCDILAARDVPLYYDGHVFNLDDDDDRNAVWQDILDGAKAVGKTRKRVLRAMEANLSANKPHGKPAPGYEIVYEGGRSAGRRVVPAQQSVLKAAAQRVLEQGSAVSMSALARELEADWRAAGGTTFFRGKDLVRYLTNPTVFGFRVHRGQIVGRGTWDPVLDPDWYPLLTAVLKDPDRLTHRGSEVRWLLSHIAKCGVCLSLGEPGVIDHKRRRSGSHRDDAYVCRDRNHVARGAARVDAYVQELWLQVLESPDAQALLLAQDEDGKATIDEELARIEQLRSEIEIFVVEAAKTRMTARSVALYVEAREAEIREVQERVDTVRARVDPNLLDLAGPGVRGRWEARSLTQKRALLRDHLSVTILPIGKQGRYSEIGVEVRPRNGLAADLVAAQGS
ncbi:recombinase family protein [Nocardia sp. N2S4-5]|uniref:recombinase family protein n=1 Tax=Nocardia sp. N2S4-5 TaxID=3351565 RepID=UPI0037CF0C83